MKGGVRQILAVGVGALGSFVAPIRACGAYGADTSVFAAPTAPWCENPQFVLRLRRHSLLILSGVAILTFSDFRIAC